MPKQHHRRLLLGNAFAFSRTISVLLFLVLLGSASPLISSSTATMTSQPKDKPKQLRTFYKRELPTCLPAFSSPTGKRIFRSAMAANGVKSFFTLIEQFTTQSEPAFCGISTLVMVLNALLVDPKRIWKGSWRWYAESMLNCCMDLEKVKKTGITLKTFACLSRCQGLSVSLQLAEHSSLDDFRHAIRSACMDDDTDECAESSHSSKISDSDNSMSCNPNQKNCKRGPYLVVSYHRQALQQTGSGHFSPIAAYDPVSDKVLILDTARFKYGPHWVDVPLLFDAMTRQDPETGLSRGFVLLSFEPRKATPFMPVSTVLQSRPKESCVKRRYAQFLQDRSSEVSWEEVHRFWTRNDTDPDLIWEVMEPTLEPLEPGYQEQLRDVRREIWRALADKLPDGHGMSEEELVRECEGSRVVCVRPEEATYVVYLASISKEKRAQELMLSSSSSSSLPDTGATLPRQQLSVEAELVAQSLFHLAESRDYCDNGGGGGGGVPGVGGDNDNDNESQEEKRKQ